jgi:hypothetical protein
LHLCCLKLHTYWYQIMVGRKWKLSMSKWHKIT